VEENVDKLGNDFLEMFVFEFSSLTGFRPKLLFDLLADVMALPRMASATAGATKLILLLHGSAANACRATSLSASF